MSVVVVVTELMTSNLVEAVAVGITLLVILVVDSLVEAG